MVRASGIRGYVRLMQSLGVDPLPLLRRCHIALESLQDDEALLPLRATMQLAELSAAQTGVGDFGLRLAERQDIGILGPLGIVLQNAPTAAQALRYASRYLFVHSPGVAMSFLDPSPRVDNAVELVFDVNLPERPQQRQTIDLTLGIAHRIIALLTGEHYRLEMVTLPHTPIAPLSHYRRFFGVPVLAQQERAALHIHRATLDASMRGTNPALRQITEDFLARHFRNPDESLSSRVRLALRRMLGTPQASKTDIAAMLAVHPRTLQRRLAAEGSSFEAIREALRQELALQYLRETTIPLGQLSGLLGFPEQSAFSRACRRWFGEAPSALRGRHRAGQAI